MRISDWSSDVCSSDLIAKQHEALRQLCDLFEHPRQIGQVIALDLDQPQAMLGMFGQQRAHQRRLASATRAPQQRMVGRHAIRSEEHTSELQSIMRTSYAVLCLKTKS